MDALGNTLDAHLIAATFAGAADQKSANSGKAGWSDPGGAEMAGASPTTIARQYPEPSLSEESLGSGDTCYLVSLGENVGQPQ
jgi:hypothetical protein